MGAFYLKNGQEEGRVEYDVGYDLIGEHIIEVGEDRKGNYIELMPLDLGHLTYWD